MTGYAYKLVSLKLGGTTDWAALKRARDKGWEPVPLGEEPVPAPNPLDMTPEQLANFTLCRMPLDKHSAIIAEREQLNRGLDNRWLRELGATFNITGHWPPVGVVLQQRLVNEDGEEVSPEIRLTEGWLADIKIAYAWLKERGLL